MEVLILQNLKIRSVHSVSRILALMMLALVALAGVSGWADAFYVINGSEMDVVLNESAQMMVPQLLQISTGAKGVDVELEEGMMVTVLHNGTSLRATAQKETVSHFLARMNVVPSPLEMVGIEAYEGGATLNISDCLTAYEKVTELAAHTALYYSDADLPYGTQVVTKEGKDGIRTAVYEQTWVAGELVSRQFVEELSTTAEPAVIREGTNVKAVDDNDRLSDVLYKGDGSGYLLFASGKTMRFKEVKEMTATAYTAGEGRVNNITATGTQTHVGVAAVDKRVIPLGTHMYVMAKRVEYGMAHAEDTGVKGNVIDLYYDTLDQCINFGRRSATVYILED